MNVLNDNKSILFINVRLYYIGQIEGEGFEYYNMWLLYIFPS